MRTKNSGIQKRIIAQGRQQRQRRGSVPVKRSRALWASVHTTVLRTIWSVLCVIGISGTLAACMGGLYKAIESSHMFGLEGIDVHGNSRIPSEEILDKAGITPGTNILTLACEDISRRLESHPWIANVSIIKRFPHRITIVIREREPAALVAVGDLYYADAGGVVFHKVNPGDRRDFPVLTGFTKEEVLSHMNTICEPVGKTMALVQIIQHYPGMVPISEINFDTRKGWTLYPLKFPVPVYLGLGNLEQKIIHLARIYHDLLVQHPPPELVDLSFPYQVVVRKAKEENTMCTTVKATPSQTKPLDSGPST